MRREIPLNSAVNELLIVSNMQVPALGRPVTGFFATFINSIKTAVIAN